MNINSHLLGDHLKNMGIISNEQLKEALQIQKDLMKDAVAPDVNPADLVTQSRGKDREVPMLGQILLDKKFISQDLLSPVLAMQNRQVRELRMLSSEKLALVIQIGFVINSTNSLDEVLSLIMKYANIVTETQKSTLMLLDEENEELVFSVPTGPSAGTLKDIRIPKSKGIAGWVLENRQAVLIDDAKSDPRFYPGIDNITGITTKSLLCVPLNAKRKIIGVLEVINKSNGSFSEEDALLLNLFSQQAAIAIENAILFESVQK